MNRKRQIRGRSLIYVIHIGKPQKVELRDVSFDLVFQKNKYQKESWSNMKSNSGSKKREKKNIRFVVVVDRLMFSLVNDSLSNTKGKWNLKDTGEEKNSFKIFESFAWSNRLYVQEATHR